MNVRRNELRQDEFSFNYQGIKPMEAFALALIFALLFQALFAEKPKDKTPEEELGAAIAKYLAKGVKTRPDGDGKS